jgi:hypothetical protein
MMATYEELLGRHIVPHTWMLFPAGWSRHGDLPDIAACAAPAPLLVQYAEEDALFTLKGMRDADARIASYYARAGAAQAYRAKFYSGPHRFDMEMQRRPARFRGSRSEVIKTVFLVRRTAKEDRALRTRLGCHVVSASRGSALAMAEEVSTETHSPGVLLKEHITKEDLAKNNSALSTRRRPNSSTGGAAGAVQDRRPALLRWHARLLFLLVTRRKHLLNTAIRHLTDDRKPIRAVASSPRTSS